MTTSLELANGHAAATNNEPPAALAALRITPVPTSTVTNGDEQLDFGGARFIGNFHKTLPRRNNGTGEVDPPSYLAFANICDTNGDFEFTAASPGASKLINPQAGRATEQIGPDPTAIHMLPAPSVLSDSTAAEMVELYWMAKVRDVNFHAFGSSSDVTDAIKDIWKAYQRALDSPTHTVGDLRLGLDLPVKGADLKIDGQTVFRCGLPDEDKGPLVSQFFLQDINYGTQLIKATQVPYKSNRDYLIAFDDWLKAQATGRDNDGNDYPAANNYSAPNGKDYYENVTKRRRIQTMRDLARFVNRDALHQAYFNAALQLGTLNAKADPGNPYGLSGRQVPFGTLGGPHLLALVSEVASRALHVVWRQKWTHRRLRPEVYGGLLSVQQIGVNGQKRQYGLPTWPFDGYLPKTKNVITGSDYFLPMAFTAGSPAHPAYGAGHATVAGACVTVLKAWYDDTQTYEDLLKNAGKGRDPSPYFPDKVDLAIWDPGTVDGNTDRCLPYKEPKSAAKKMTVGGELNKLAANVAMGRSMGGVHWRTDNTRSLRLGEQISTIILSQLLPTLPEKPSLRYTNFDGNLVTIAASGTVSVPNDPALEAFYVGPF